MSAKHWLIISIIALIADLLTLHLNSPALRLITKPMIVLPLIGFVISCMHRIQTTQKYALLFALVFSCVGDVALVFATKTNHFFLKGIFSFLLAHISYGMLFLQLKRKNTGWHWLMIFAFYGYGIVLFFVFRQNLGEALKPAVLTYMIIICTMLILSLHIEKSITQKIIALGAILFVFSDSLLANQMFYHKIMLGNQLVMLFYGFAQMLITFGVMEHWQTKKLMEVA